MNKIFNDGSVFLQDCNGPPSFTLCHLITDDNWCGSVVVEESILQTRRQRLQLRKERLWFLLLIELTLLVWISFLGKVGHIFFKNRLSLLFLANWASPSRTYSAKIRILKITGNRIEIFKFKLAKLLAARNPFLGVVHPGNLFSGECHPHPHLKIYL